MGRRHVHYEAAFEDYVRLLGWPYVPVDQARKAVLGGSPLKSFDFLVYRPEDTAWLVDIKGRKFPYETGGALRYWENWVTAEDLDSLASWGTVFGDRFEPVLMFAYWLLTPQRRVPTASSHAYGGTRYSFLWLPAAEYARHARRRSDRWDTLSMPTAEFRRLARPLESPAAVASPTPKIDPLTGRGPDRAEVA